MVSGYVRKQFCCNCAVSILCCGCSGFYVAFVVGVLRVFDEINYVALRSAGERVFCGYMKIVLLSQRCAVTVFGEGIYFGILHEGQCVTVTQEKPVCFL